MAGGSAFKRSPITDARKAAPSVITRAAKCSTAAQAAGSPDVQEERNYRTRVRLYSGSLLKGGTVLPHPEEFLASSCLIRLAFLLKFQQRDVPPFHCCSSFPLDYLLSVCVDEMLPRGSALTISEKEDTLLSALSLGLVHVSSTAPAKSLVGTLSPGNCSAILKYFHWEL